MASILIKVGLSLLAFSGLSALIYMMWTSAVSPLQKLFTASICASAALVVAGIVLS